MKRPVMAFATCLAMLTLPIAGIALGPRASGDVNGRVVDQTGKPVTDATVSIVELGRAASSDAEGRFRFAGIPAGRVTVAVRRLGYLSTARQIVVADAPIDLTLTVQSGGRRIEPVNVTATREPIAA